MVPIAGEFDLGKAHGTVVIDYEDKGAKHAQDDMKKMNEHANTLMQTFTRFRGHLSDLSQGFGETGARFSRNFAIFSGGVAIMLGLSRAMGTFQGRLFALKGGMSILGALGIGLGGLPRSVQGFPNVIKQIILLSTAITLFAGSTKLLNSLFVAMGRFVGSTAIFQRLTAAFPALTGQIQRLASFLPSIKQVGEGINNIASPVHRIARLALTIGAVILAVRNGVSIAFALAKGIAAIGTASSAVILTVKAVAALAGVLKELSGLVGLLPGALGIFAATTITAKLGLLGFKDALKNFGDLEKFEESLKNMAPSAAGFLRELRNFKPAFDDIQKSIQQELFRDLARQIRPLAENYLPVLRDGAGQVAGALNRVIVELAQVALQGRNIQSVKEIFGLTAQFIDNARVALAPFISALLDLAVVGGQVLVDLSGGFKEVGENFASLVGKARDSGELKAWIEGGVQALINLIATLVNLGQILGIVFSAFGVEAGGVTTAMQAATDSLRNFLRSAEGQVILTTLVDTIRLLSGVTTGVLMEALKALVPVLIALRPFIEQVAEAMGGSLLIVIQALAPLFLAVAQAISFMAPVLAPVIGFFLGLGAAGKLLLLLFAPIGAALNLLVAGFTLFKGAITAVTTAWKILQFVFAVSPWTIIIAALVLLVILIITNWDTIKEYLITAWNWISDVAEKVWGAISDFFSGIWDGIVSAAQTAWTWILDFLKGIWEGIKFIFFNFTIVGLIIQYWDDILAFTQSVWETIKNFLSDVWNSIVESTRWIWEPIVEILKSIWSIITDLISIAINLILIIIIAVWDAIKYITVGVWQDISDKLALAWQFITDAFHSIWDPIVEWWNAFWEGIKTSVTETWTDLTNWLQEQWDIAITAWHMMFDPIIDWWNNFWTTISDWVEEKVNDVVEWIKWAWDLAWKIWHDTFDPIINWFKGIWDTISKTVSDGAKSVVDWIGGIPGWIKDRLGDLGSLLLNAGKAIIQGFLNGLKDAFKGVQDFVGGIADWVASHKGPLSYDRRLLTPAGVAIMNGLLGGLASKRSAITGFLDNLTSDIANGLDVAGKEISAATGSLATSTNVGIITTAASAVTSPATAGVPVTAPATAVTGTASAGSGDTLNIDKVEVNLNGLNPTDPMEWKKTIDAIHEGIRKKDKEMK